MNRPRITIAGWMTLMVFAAINASLARAFVVDREFFEGIVLIAVAFQVGLAGIILGRGRARRFWVGFLVAEVAAVLGLIAAETPETTWNGWVSAYTGFAMNLAFARLPMALADYVEEHQGQLVALIYFGPILAAALAGGALLAIAARPRQASQPSTPDQSRS